MLGLRGSNTIKPHRLEPTPGSWVGAASFIVPQMGEAYGGLG